MRKLWIVAVIAAFGMAGCEPAAETADADEAMEEASGGMAADVATALPAPGDYNLVAAEGGGAEEGFEEGDVGVLHLEESTWTFEMNGEQIASGTWSAEEGRVRVTHETGDCAGHDAVLDIVVTDVGFTDDLVESTCETAWTHEVWERAGGDMM